MCKGFSLYGIKVFYFGVYGIQSSLVFCLWPMMILFLAGHIKFSEADNIWYIEKSFLFMAYKAIFLFMTYKGRPYQIPLLK